jgi:peptidoglycan/LPS O-acetylase OafA/YrhL
VVDLAEPGTVALWGAMAGSKANRDAGAPRTRFAILDLLRGLAALVVLEHHYPRPGGEPLFGVGYIAVDLFFVLSGYVLAHAYFDWLRRGAHPARFFRARLIRLYPLYLLATLLQASFSLLWSVGIDPGAALPKWSGTVATALVMLPTPPTWSLQPGVLFPFLVQAWSLFWELVVNLIYAAWAKVTKGRVPVLLILAGAAGLIFGALTHGAMNLGWGWDGAVFGGARALYGLFVGIALWLVRERWRAPSIPAWLVALVMLLALMPHRLGAGYELAVTLVVVPMIVWFGASATSGRAVDRVGRELGLASYAIYVLQDPLRLVYVVVMNHVPRLRPALPLDLDWALSLVFIMAASWLLTRWIDQPVREALTKRLTPDRPPVPAQAAP